MILITGMNYNIYTACFICGWQTDGSVAFSSIILQWGVKLGRFINTLSTSENEEKEERMKAERKKKEQEEEGATVHQGEIIIIPSL